MDQVQRAYESQLRREDCKRKQLQNSVMIEEHKRWREHEKEQRELVRQHMLAAQQLKRLQVEEMEAAERQRQAREMLDAQPLCIEAAKPRATAMSSAAMFMPAARSVQAESYVMSDVVLDNMGTEYLRHQAGQLAKLKADEKELHRAVTYQRAREEEEMRSRYHQHKLDEAEAKSFFVLQANAADVEARRGDLQHRQQLIRSKVASRETELLEYRNLQEEAYEAKRIKAEMLAEEKRHMQDNMTARRVALAKEEQRYTSAIATMRSSQRVPAGDWSAMVHQASGGGNTATPRLEYRFTTPQRPRPASSLRSRPPPARAAPPPPPPPRAVSTQRPARVTPASPPRTRCTATPSRARPASASAAMAGAHDELELKMLEEHKRERERENIMKQVSDPRQRARLHKLFAIERQQAKQAILRLQG